MPGLSLPRPQIARLNLKIATYQAYEEALAEAHARPRGESEDGDRLGAAEVALRKELLARIEGLEEEKLNLRQDLRDCGCLLDSPREYSPRTCSVRQELIDSHNAEERGRARALRDGGSS